VTPKTQVQACTARYKWALAAVLFVGALSAGCGGSGNSGGAGSPAATGGQSAAAFIRGVTTQFSLGQSGRLWDTLHPADQAVVSRTRYMACQSNSGFDLKKIKVLDSYADPIDIAGKTTPATAVSVRTTADDGVTTATVHAVLLQGKWRWVLSPADYAAYQHGKCPGSA
jgi:hypothetical protein